MINNSKEALATHLMMDRSELNEFRYQPGRYTIPVYAFTEEYYCATKGNAKPAKRTRDDLDFDWKEKPDNYVNQFGFHIWIATTTK